MIALHIHLGEDQLSAIQHTYNNMPHFISLKTVYVECKKRDYFFEIKTRETKTVHVGC